MTCLVFLDCDGILNRTSTWDGSGQRNPTEPELVANLHRLIAETGAVIVLTSTWRLIAADVLEMFHQGILTYDNVAWPDICIGNEFNIRGEGILDWFGRNPLKKDMRFVILDDDISDIVCYPQLAPHVVKVDREHGLNEETVQRALQVLRGL